MDLSTERQGPRSASTDGGIHTYLEGTQGAVTKQGGNRCWENPKTFTLGSVCLKKKVLGGDLKNTFLP